MRAFCLAVAATMFLAGTVNAATLHEGAGAEEFSDSWKNPTVVGAGFDQISGSWSGWNDYDILGFTSLRTGVQTVALSFSPQSPIGVFDWNFAAGGRLYYPFEAPRYSAWEGTPFGSLDMSYRNRNDDFTHSLRLGDEFRGVLYLALYGTYGSLNYNVTVPGNALPVPTPQTEDVLADPVVPEPLSLPADSMLGDPAAAAPLPGGDVLADPAQPAPVPLPAGMALLPFARAALAFLRRHKAR